MTNKVTTDTAPNSITVAIVTARDDGATTYAKWRAFRQAFLSRRSYQADGKEYSVQSKYLRGEFGALLAVSFATPMELRSAIEHHHVDHQVIALEAGTEMPEKILAVNRLERFQEIGRDVAYPHVRWVQPLLSPLEIERQPELLISPMVAALPRAVDVSYGCSDKNTAIVLCQTDGLVMLDDCCLPSFGLVETARQVCREGNVLLIGHRKVFLPTEERPELDVAEANWTEQPQTLTVDEAKRLRRVFGIWAMPLQLALELNGYNTKLDGFRGSDDIELLERMDRYMTQHTRLRYVVHPAARVYEIEHGNPWSDGEVKDWTELCPKGWSWKAPGSSLAALRDAAMRFAPKPEEDADDEDEDDEDDD